MIDDGKKAISFVSEDDKMNGSQLLYDHSRSGNSVKKVLKLL